MKHSLTAARWVSRHPARILLAVFALSLGGSAIVSLTAGIPLANRHDEHSYLLAADSYSRGRLANSPHPHWEHFESPHIIQQPTYASKYQPAQGLVLAAGQRLGGQPIIGVWLSVALMCAAVTWMLMGLVPARWALAGGILTALDFGVAGLWAQSYWGGAVAATGGALVFGALARLHRGVAWPSAMVFASGALILLFSRPFEGSIIVLVAAATLVAMGRRWTWPEARPLLGSLVAAAVIGGALLGQHNRAVTGDPLVLPYQLHSRQYDAAPLFIFQAAPTRPEYRNERLETLHADWELETYEYQRSPAAWGVGLLVRPAVAGLAYFFGPPKRTTRGTAWVPGILILPFLLLPFLWRSPRERFALATVAALFLALSVVSYFVPHYMAVVAGLWMFLVVQALRRLRVAARRMSIRTYVVPLAIAWTVLLAGLAVVEQRSYLSDADRWFRQKERITDQLAVRGGRHVVLVRYDPDYDVHAEWVYNTAEIDGQDVIWAHDLGAAANAGLVDYYPDRSAWLLLLSDDTPPELEPCTHQLNAGTCVSR